MELLFVLVIAAAIGAILRYVLPGRHSHGMLLMPAVDVVVTGVLWAVLTWVGWKFSGGWIWGVAIGGGGIATVAADIIVWQARTRGDKRLLHELSGGRA